MKTTEQIPSEKDLEQLRSSIEEEARRRGFSDRKTARFMTWILGFTSWCVRTSPYNTLDNPFENFREALRDHPETDEADVHEAMDALAFLYGAVERGKSLPSFLPDPDGRSSLDDSSEESSEGASQPTTLRVGWQHSPHSIDQS